MIDTIKVGIPLNFAQHRKILSIAKDSDRWQWVQVNRSLGELRFIKESGLLTTDHYSYHRELKWDVSATYSEDCKLFLEFSVPKYWYGHNIHLLYDFVGALSSLKSALERLFSFKGKNKLPDPSTWHLYRLDICYAWRLPSQMAAQEYLDSLKHLHYPRKRPVIYPTSIVFQGTTYTVKFYLKRPEFEKHDGRELVKAGAELEWVNYLESLADGVLRCEATLRRKYLKVAKLLTVGDLLQPLKRLHWDDAVVQASDGLPSQLLMVLVLSGWSQLNGIDLSYNLENGIETPLRDGQYFSMPPCDVPLGDIAYHHPGGGFTYREENRLVVLLNGFIQKFIGGGARMQEANEVRAKLLESYKPVKAARLISVWLYVQRFGSESAKQTFGDNSYYRAKRELKQAGISLIENRKSITVVDESFFKEFNLSVPSEHVTNAHDDFRDSGNILNFVPLTSGQF